MEECHGLRDRGDETICTHTHTLSLRRMGMDVSSWNQIPVLTPCLTPPVLLWGHAELLQFLQISPVPGPRKGVNLISLAGEPGQIFHLFSLVASLNVLLTYFFVNVKITLVIMAQRRGSIQQHLSKLWKHAAKPHCGWHCVLMPVTGQKS